MGLQLKAGLDEVGRGCLAGPVYAAAVILKPRSRIQGLRDSKALSAKRREQLAGIIRERALSWAVGVASVEEIERLNILQASLLAMQRAASALSEAPELAQVDGNQAPDLGVPVQTVVGGDAKIAAIMSASILAKVARDAEMRRLDGEFPGYGFERNKGYGTRDHFEALQRLGPCQIHRRGFAPIAQLRFEYGQSAVGQGL